MIEGGYSIIKLGQAVKKFTLLKAMGRMAKAETTVSKPVAEVVEVIERPELTGSIEVNTAESSMQGFKSLGAAAKGSINIGSNARKMTLDEIGGLLGEGWHKNSAKTKFIGKFLTQLKGSTNADLYINKVTKEILLKGNKSNAWVQTNRFLK